MKRFIFALILLLFHISIFCQNQKNIFKKTPIELSILGKWPSVSSISVSGDGNYVIYSINNPATSTNPFYVQSLKTDWNLNVGSVPCQFTADSKYVIFKKGKDSLTVMSLDNKQPEFISNVSSFKISNGGKWIAYLDNQKKLTLKNLETKKEIFFESVNGYFLNPNENSLLLESNQSNGNQTLLVASFYDGRTTQIWNAQEGGRAGNYFFSKEGKQLAFVVENKSENFIWLYKDGETHASEIAKEKLKSVSQDLFLSGINYMGFTEDGNKLFIELKEKTAGNSNKEGVDVWSYTDTRLQSQQLKQLKPKTFIGIVSIADDKLIRLEQPDDKLISCTNDYALIANIRGDMTYDEWYWNKAVKSSVYLVCLKNGERKLIRDSLPAVLASSYWLSPEGKYVIFYDAIKKSYFSHETGSGKERNITQSIKAEWTRYDKRDIRMGKYMPIFCATAGWLKDDKAVILYSQCDVFQVDPSGKALPICLTNGLGKNKNVEFRLAIENNQIFDGDEELYLSAFNRVNKNDGFFKVKLGERKNPELLTAEAAIYKGTWEDERFPPVYPIKANDAGIYLVRKMTASESPNYFWTKDFKGFNRITNVHPERESNWLTTELINWKTSDGKTCQGILYKPQDFDPSKKYPVIFHYYERVTEALNAFIVPEVSHGELNIPYFVSNGYLVFTPDFHYVEGHPGNSVLNTVVSAAQYLSKLPYIDSRHIGLQGHSRGGWETNFIITHTSVFAAAVSASGMSDYVSLYNEIRSFRQGVSRQAAFEIFYQRIGATLWERPDLFIENSPIFKVNKTTTPVLMMCNKDDDDVPFEQGVEFFTALRRLGKKAWMLQYDQGEHIVFGDAAQDFTIRMRQFFDCYLKGEKPSKWIAEGVPVKYKGKANVFE